tara:strand:+ start:1292 stop:1768 length:477 start_codon:yes stop_codon:yes gene_type:complete
MLTGMIDRKHCTTYNTPAKQQSWIGDIILQGIIFTKTSEEIKSAIKHRVQALQARLDRRNQTLDEIIGNQQKVRSYMIRSSVSNYSHGRESTRKIFSSEHIPLEEVQEINKLCQRIYELESEIYRLKLVSTHLKSGENHRLQLQELVFYGFQADEQTA